MRALLLCSLLTSCSGAARLDLPPPPRTDVDRLADRAAGALVVRPRSARGAPPLRAIALSDMGPAAPAGVEIDAGRESIDVQVSGMTRQPLVFRTPIEGGRILRLRAMVEAKTPLTANDAVRLDVIERDATGTTVDRWVSSDLPGGVDHWWRSQPSTTQIAVRVILGPKGPWFEMGGAGLQPGHLALRNARLEIHGESADHNLHAATGLERVDGDVREALYAPAGTTWAWRVRVPAEGARLDVAAAALQDEPVEFEVRVDGKVRASTTGSRHWQDVNVRLSGPAQPVVELVTTGRTGAGAVWSGPVVARRQRNPRRLVLIDLDTAGALHSSLGLGDGQTTPWILGMGQRGRIFRNGFSTQTWTLPSHIDIFSGKANPTMLELPPGTSFVHRLREAGFLTAAFTGGGYVDPVFGFGQGFERFRNYGARETHAHLRRYLGDALRFLKRNPDRDMFLFLHGYDVHHPYELEPEYEARFVRGNPATVDYKMEHDQPFDENDFNTMRGQYRGAYRMIDDGLRDWYRQAEPLLRGATIVITSDHGEELGEHGKLGHGAEPYREQAWVPMVGIGPDFPRGTVEESARSLLDVAPTFLAAAGLDPRGLIGLPLQHAAPANRTVASFGRGTLAIRDSSRTFMMSHNGRVRSFDRTTDPIEQTDLGPDRYDDLSQLSRLWFQQHGRGLGAGGTRPQAPVPPEVAEQLRALGYVQ